MKNKTIYTIKIKNWEKYNPKAVQNRSWVAISTHMFMEPGFANMTWSERMWWISLLCECGRQNKGGGLVELWLETHTTMYGSRGGQQLVTCLTMYSDLQWIQVLAKNGVPIQTDRHTHKGENEVLESQQEEKKPSPSRSPIIFIWNETNGLVKIKNITPQLEKLSREAWHFKPDLDFWRTLLKRISKTPFLTGGGEKGWVADLTWVLDKGNWARIDEGFYERMEKTNPSEKRKITLVETTKEKTK